MSPLATIILAPRSAYGQTRYYPACERSKVVAEQLTVSASLGLHHIAALKAMGFRVVTMGQEGKEL